MLPQLLPPAKGGGNAAAAAAAMDTFSPRRTLKSYSPRQKRAEDSQVLADGLSPRLLPMLTASGQAASGRGIAGNDALGRRTRSDPQGLGEASTDSDRSGDEYPFPSARRQKDFDDELEDVHPSSQAFDLRKKRKSQKKGYGEVQLPSTSGSTEGTLHPLGRIPESIDSHTPDSGELLM
eukprot:gb/GFBE01042182.1/.p1 GENE.gb/GFBE01042182.1/~~gb/GFBE01042182.1/.p1  ORF type:complete len:179 (+),score=17.92 gb/GFBE01042182.1/:1-537(+)